MDKPNNTTSNIIRLTLLSIIVGIGAGILAVGLAYLLHTVQHVAYGYSPDIIIGKETFFEGVSASSSERRVIALLICGLIAGFGWWALYRYGKPLVSITDTIKTDKRMPVFSTIIHTLLQIITVALGSPLGREVAPRELGTLFAAWVNTHTKLSEQECKILLACGAGAGLAAVYNVPFGGALFIIEVLFASYSYSIIIPALAACAVATLISWVGIGNVTTYDVSNVNVTTSLLVWAVLTAPIFGISAYYFSQITQNARAKAIRGNAMIAACFVNFALIGLLSVYFPVLLGNGKSPVQLEFTGNVGIFLSALLLGLRWVITWSSLRAGASGGLLTPSLANGALLAAVLGGIWNYIWPNPSYNGYIVIGATAFLAAAQKMPLTAIVLIFEFTHVPLAFLVPIMLAVSLAMAVFQYCSSHPPKI